MDPQPTRSPSIPDDPDLQEPWSDPDRSQGPGVPETAGLTPAGVAKHRPADQPRARRPARIRPVLVVSISHASRPPIIIRWSAATPDGQPMSTTLASRVWSAGSPPRAAIGSTPTGSSFSGYTRRVGSRRPLALLVPHSVRCEPTERAATSLSSNWLKASGWASGWASPPFRSARRR